MKRAILVCPGRGSYSREDLGMLQDIESNSLDRLNTHRRNNQQPTPRELDAASRFTSQKHIAGDQASLLTAACTLADLDQIDPDKITIVGACGNSMGWYTTLAAAGVLSIEDAATLIDTLGGYQKDALIGGQIVYPIADSEWRLDTDGMHSVETCIQNHSELFWSIRLGSQAIIGGSDDGIRHAMETLEAREVRGRTFPIRLPLHAAFHTPLMTATASRAQQDLDQLVWQAPRWPIVDGHGHIWYPHDAEPTAIRDYTLGPQINETFDFNLMLTTLLGETGPDLIILPGPGSNLGGAIAQVLISLGWSGIHQRIDFMARQESDPILLALARPEQRKRATH